MAMIFNWYYMMPRGIIYQQGDLYINSHDISIPI